jgi:hypothetical protein
MASKMKEMSELDFTVTYDEKVKLQEVPDNPIFIKKVLYSDFEDIKLLWNYANHDYSYYANSSKDYLGLTYSAATKMRINRVAEQHKLFWLFKDMPLDDYSERIKFFIIDKNDAEVSILDYAVLLYVYFQDKNTKQTLEKLPLSMLYDILVPIADENFKSWMRV